jgi:hypothetical protein
MWFQAFNPPCDKAKLLVLQYLFKNKLIEPGAIAAITIQSVRQGGRF